MKTLVILAGGKSSRMGRDKVLLEIGGKTFIEHLYEKALVFFERVIISTDTPVHADVIRRLPFFSQLAPSDQPRIVTDLYSEKGPMGGIVSVFESTDAEKFAIISVDVPHADMQVLSFLYDQCTKSACYLRFEGRKRESLIAAYSRSAYPHLKAALDSGMYKLRMALSEEEVQVISAQDAGFGGAQAAFTNFNTPQDLIDLQMK